MAIDIDFAGDFSQVVDITVPITLKRRRGGSIAIVKAWRFETTVVEPEATGGHVASTDTRWQFEWPTATPPPKLGDRLIDDAGVCSVVVRVEPAGGNTRWRVTARNLSIAFGLDNRVAIELAQWDSGPPATITGWKLVDPAVPAHIQPQALVADLDESPPTHEQTFRVTLDTELTLDGNHRLVTADGTTYRVREFENASRIDRLPVAVAEPI